MYVNEGRVLVVDDESSVRRALVMTLGGLGFEVGEAANGERAVELSRADRFDVVLLDINMPGMGGIAACGALRSENPHLAILMLTVRDNVEDKILALDAGADDYVTKPFELGELTARLRASIRRARAIASPNERTDVTIRVGQLELYVKRRQLFREGREIRLTPKEFDLLYHLMLNIGIPMRHTQLLQTVWGTEYGTELEYLRTFIHQLRKKIGDEASQPQYLRTEPFIGYRFCDPTAANEMAAN
jgi:two-component system KDP operon response regulator KdpE